MRNLYTLILFSFAQLIYGQNGFHIGGQVGYTMNEGPLEKYQGVQLGTNVRYQIKNFFIQSGYDHITGIPNYGQYYSKELPNVPVYDIYNENYGLAIYPSDDFSEVKVGVHQFDPSYGKYVARQISFGIGYKIQFKFNKFNCALSPTLNGYYRYVNENFIYGVKEIKIEDTFQSNNFVPVNHLIFAYLRYSNLGYLVNFPIELSLNHKTNMTTSFSIGKSLNHYLHFGLGLGLITKI